MPLSIAAGADRPDASHMGMEAGPGEAPAGERGKRTRPGAALLPVFNIPDRATIAYEVLSRPDPDANEMAVLRAAFDAAQHTSPAILLIRCLDVVGGDGGEAAALVRQYGITPSEVAWIVDSSLCKDPDADRRIATLRASGFRFAVEASGWAAGAHQCIAAYRPDFLLIEPESVQQVPDSALARAELAALISFTARLDVSIIARGVDTPPVAAALAAVGLQHGSGAHLSQPLVLDSSLAAAGDAIVDAAWFRRHAPRRLDAVRDDPIAPTHVVALHESERDAVSPDDVAQTLAEAARLLQAEHDPGRIMGVVAELLPRVIPMSAMAILEADWETDTFIPRLLAGDQVAPLRDVPFPMSRGVTGWAFARGVPYNCSNTLTHPAAGTVPGTEDDSDDESMLVIPLIAGDHRIGVLDVWRRGVAQFSDRDMQLCSLFAHIAAAAWQNAILYREVEHRARTDALTGLHNTRWLDEVMPQEAARTLRAGAQIGVLLLDLDHFKLVNDTGGHATGDRALRNVARVLRSVVRAGDDVVRYGGEEFLILLHDSGPDGAVRVAEEVRQALFEMPPAVPDVRTTASIGVAVFPLHGETLDEVVREADLMMYRAKSSGRDRVVAAPVAAVIAQAS